ncbi:MAG: hypothetical protein Q7J70_06835 [Thermodesulfovibrionales bacterium]|nr:hypothetical protein [Thermodesulfovibrionales bacterium]
MRYDNSKIKDLTRSALPDFPQQIKNVSVGVIHSCEAAKEMVADPIL